MTDNTTDALTPVEERIVDFYGDRVAAALVPAGELYVPARPIAEALGLTWASQNNRIQRDEVLARRVRKVIMHGADGKAREMVCLPLELLAGWIFGVTTSKVRPELREKLTRYREEYYRVLWEAFRDRLVGFQGLFWQKATRLPNSSASPRWGERSRAWRNSRSTCSGSSNTSASESTAQDRSLELFRVTSRASRFAWKCSRTQCVLEHQSQRHRLPRCRSG